MPFVVVVLDGRDGVTKAPPTPSPTALPFPFPLPFTATPSPSPNNLLPLPPTPVPLGLDCRLLVVLCILDVPPCCEARVLDGGGPAFWFASAFW